MERSRLFATLRRGAAIMAVLASACAVDNQEAPALAGPSGFALSLTLTASPDVLPRDGVTGSTIRVLARGADGKPIAGQRLVVSTSAGTLSASEVTTGSGGDATFLLNPLPPNQELSEVVVTATGVGADSANSATRTVNVTVVGPSPSVSFTVNPASPRRLQLTTLVATAFVNGVLCGTECAYNWKLDDGNVLPTGRTIVYRFEQARAYVVTLTVTAPSGATGTKSEIVTVTPPVPPNAVITFSPKEPAPGETIFLDGRSSTADPDGDTHIARYDWDFGDGQTTAGNDAVVVHSYALAKKYTVRLTVTDNLNRSATTTIELDVK